MLLFTPFTVTRFAMHRIYADRINSRGMSRVFCDLCSQKTPRGILPVNSNFQIFIFIYGNTSIFHAVHRSKRKYNSLSVHTPHICKHYKSSLLTSAYFWTCRPHWGGISGMAYRFRPHNRIFAELSARWYSLHGCHHAPLETPVPHLFWSLQKNS